MAPKGVLLCSLDSVPVVSFPVPDASRPYLRANLEATVLYYPPIYASAFQMFSFLQRFRSKTLFLILISPVDDIDPSHLIVLDLSS